MVEISRLREHEQVSKEYLNNLKNEIISDQLLKQPIVVDENTFVILDGHHRLNALKELNLAKIPVIFVDYSLPEIKVRSRRRSKLVTKQTVINAGLSGNKFPVKTSKHIIKIDKKPEHISVIQKRVDIPLKKLK